MINPLRNLCFSTPLAVEQTSGQSCSTCQVLNQKMQSIWDQFLCALHIRSKIIIADPAQRKLAAITKIQTELNRVDVQSQNQPKSALCDALRQAFQTSIQVIKAEGLDPVKLPKEVAQKLAEIIGRFGIAIYANKDVCTQFTHQDEVFKHSFLYSLNTLKAAIAMENYALGMSETCPDLSSLTTIDELYNREEIVTPITQHANEIIESMSSSTWAAKAAALNQKQQIALAVLLRYTNGAMRYLKIHDLKHKGNLILTAEAILMKCQQNQNFDQVEVNNEMAELIYNDMTGFFKEIADDCEAKGEKEFAMGARAALSEMWDACVKLSKFPEKMRARCDNKRTFIEQLTPEQEAELRQRSLKAHLSLPQEQQDKVLIALSNHNLANLYYQLEKTVEKSQKAEMKKFMTAHSAAAIKLAIECMQNGINDVQFDSIINQARMINAEYGEKKT